MIRLRFFNAYGPGERYHNYRSVVCLMAHRALTGRPWTVAFCGFAPGFGYLTGGDPRLTVPRRPTPRVRVPAGSVGLAGPFSGIYPRESPGGWQLIGRTEIALWNPEASSPALLRPGTRVTFREVRDG